MADKQLSKNISYSLGVKTLLIQIRDDFGQYKGCKLFQIAYDKVPWYRRRTARIIETPVGTEGV